MFLQRPSAKELLKFPFIRKAKKNSFLIDLIEKYKRYKAAGGGKSDSDSDASDSYVDKPLQTAAVINFVHSSDDSKSISNSDTLTWDLTIKQNPKQANKIFDEAASTANDQQSKKSILQEVNIKQLSIEKNSNGDVSNDPVKSTEINNKAKVS